MSETASFVDPVFLARFGLSRGNVVDYFLHPLNPFRVPNTTSNEVLNMQGISIMILTQFGTNQMPLSPMAAEEAFAKNLSKLTGHQYELLQPDPNASDLYTQQSPLYTLRHVFRTSQTSVKVLGIYYVVEGVIYKSPPIRSLMKSNVARTLDGLAGKAREESIALGKLMATIPSFFTTIFNPFSVHTGACSSLSVCARYLPSTGYTWNFDMDDDDHVDDVDIDDDDTGNDSASRSTIDPTVSLMKLNKRMKRRRILDNRKTGERNEAEEEGLRASAAIDQILVRLSKNSHIAASRDEDGYERANQLQAVTKIHEYQGNTIMLGEPTTSK